MAYVNHACRIGPSLLSVQLHRAAYFVPLAIKIATSAARILIASHKTVHGEVEALVNITLVTLNPYRDLAFFRRLRYDHLLIWLCCGWHLGSFVIGAD